VEFKHSCTVQVRQLQEREVGHWAGGSRIEGVAAAASTRDSLYQGRYATVVDAEMAGIAKGGGRARKWHWTAKG